jgi:hypothetical protein
MISSTAQSSTAVQAPNRPLVLGDEPGEHGGPVVVRGGREGAPVQDADGGLGPHHCDLRAQPR